MKKYKMIGVDIDTYKRLKKAIGLYQYKYDEYEDNISFNCIINKLLDEVEIEWEDK